MQKTISAVVYVREAVKRVAIPALAAELRARGARVELLNSGRAMFVNFTKRPTEPGLNPENLANAKAIGVLTQYLHPFLRETHPVPLGLPSDHFEAVVALPADEERRDKTVRPARGKGGPPWNIVRLPIRHGGRLDAIERTELSAESGGLPDSPAGWRRYLRYLEVLAEEEVRLREKKLGRQPICAALPSRRWARREGI